jgi:hypothetical protein
VRYGNPFRAHCVYRNAFTGTGALALVRAGTQSAGGRIEETVPMVRLRRLKLAALLLPGALLTLAGCSSLNITNPFDTGPPPPPPPPPAAPVIPPSLRADEIVGRWGLASYHREQDRTRTEAAARGQCTQPYTISRSPTGGVMMLGHDNPAVQDMTIKGSPEGKTYIGPGPVAGSDDREVVSFDGRVLILRWIDPEVAGRYGNMVLVRCAPEGARTARRKPPPPPPQ